MRFYKVTTPKWRLAVLASLAILGLALPVFAQGLEPELALPTYAPSADEALPAVSLHGGIYLWYYRPQQSWIDEDFSVNYAYVVVDATYQDFGVRLEGRMADQLYQNYYTSNIWFQEAFLYYRQPKYIVKLGKTYEHFGHFWDGSMYGNVLAFDGLKLSPDDGISFESKPLDSKHLSVNFDFQCFVEDGLTNDSLDGDHSGAPLSIVGYDSRTGRDTLTIDGGRRRDEVIGRLENIVHLGSDGQAGDLALGLNYMYLLADTTTLPPPPQAPNIHPGRYNVHRYAFDVTYTRGPLTMFAEFDHQHGQTVIDYPYEGDPATKIDYYWAGISYKTGRWTWYYNYSEALYDGLINPSADDQPVHNITQVPGFAYDVQKYVQFIFEYGYMYRLTTGSFFMNDNSLNFFFKASI